VTSQQDQRYDAGADDIEPAEQDTDLPAGRHAGLADENMPGRPASDDLEDHDLEDEDLEDEDLEDEDLAEEPEEDLSGRRTFVGGAGAEEIIVAEVIDESPTESAASAEADPAMADQSALAGQPAIVGEAPGDQSAMAGQPAMAGEATGDSTTGDPTTGDPTTGDPTTGGQTTGAGRSSALDTDLGQQWHDIQATFVDDPRGAVGMAAEATNTALAGLIDSLRARQDALSQTAGATAPERQDTEQLRGELRQYRTLCESLAQIGQQIADLQPA
jgi:hypothetical protein